LRIDRVFRQPQGHLLLIGLSGTGKATLCRFVSWLNQINFVQLKVSIACSVLAIRTCHALFSLSLSLIVFTIQGT
jgi:ABC-type proline/glycine betaine transport system ATPase subunit